MAAPHAASLGLAGAEKRLYELNLNQGEMSVQRQVMQFRVDYLSDLNTQSMLLAGVAASMLGSLELEAMQPEEEELQTPRRMVLVGMYVLGACTSLGASVWVLYTSNNLVNSALVAQLYGSTLADMQNAESVLALRMLDVRKMYIIALLTMLPAQLIMVSTLINHMVAVPACFVVAWFLAHAIHADFATAWHLERYNIPLHEMRPEYWIEGVAQRFFRRDGATNSRSVNSTDSNQQPEDTPISNFVERRLRSLFGSNSYTRLGERVHVAASQKRHAHFENPAELWPDDDCVECVAEEAEHELMKLRQKPGRITFANSEIDSMDGSMHGSHDHHHHHHSAAMIQKHWQRIVRGRHGVHNHPHSEERKKPSRSPVPRHALPAAAPPTTNMATGETYGTMCKTPSEKGPSQVIHSLAIGPLGPIETLRSTPANTPGHVRWWVLNNGNLSCYKNETEWREHQPPKISVDLHEYACERAWDPNGMLCIALIPRHVLYPKRQPKASRPTSDSDSDRSWYLCAYPASFSNSRMTEQWLTLLNNTCQTGEADCQPGRH